MSLMIVCDKRHYHTYPTSGMRALDMHHFVRRFLAVIRSVEELAIRLFGLLLLLATMWAILKGHLS
jgi:hypothetical protein